MDNKINLQRVVLAFNKMCSVDQIDENGKVHCLYGTTKYLF